MAKMQASLAELQATHASLKAAIELKKCTPALFLLLNGLVLADLIGSCI